MINLLPIEHKKELRAARANVLLVRYLMITLAAVAVLGALLVGAYIVLNTARSQAEIKVAENQQRVTGFQSVRQQADSFRADLATADSVFKSKTSYVKLVYKIAAIVPKNVILDSLTLDAKSFGSTATMNASAKTFDDGTRLKEAFLANNEIFSDVQFQRLQYTSTGSEPSGAAYPVKVSLSVVINKGALQ